MPLNGRKGDWVKMGKYKLWELISKDTQSKPETENQRFEGLQTLFLNIQQIKIALLITKILLYRIQICKNKFLIEIYRELNQI